MRAVGLWLLCLAGACSTRPNPAYRPGSLGDATVDEAADVAAMALDGPGSTLDVAGPEAPEALGLYDAAVVDASAADAPVADERGVDLGLDRGPDVRPDGAPDAFTLPAGCGTGVANISGIANADGLAIDTDGTVYFLTDDSTNSYVGRIRPGLAPEIKWLRVDNSPTTWGLALDSARKRLYVLVVDGPGALVAFDDIAGTPKGSVFFSGIGNGNDVVVGSDGTVYYTQQTDRHIYSLPVGGGSATRVTSTSLGNTSLNQTPAALAVTSDGNLVVGLEHGGPVYKITLVAGHESSRAGVGTWMGWANGLVFDRNDRLYIAMDGDAAPQAVVRIEPDGSTKTLISGSRYSSIAFGRGALDCRDLYVADPYGPMHVLHVPDSL